MGGKVGRFVSKVPGGFEATQVVKNVLSKPMVNKLFQAGQISFIAKETIGAVQDIQSGNSLNAVRTGFTVTKVFSGFKGLQKGFKVEKLPDAELFFNWAIDEPRIYGMAPYIVFFFKIML